MLDLLIAILISLGSYVETGATAEELKAKDPVAYERASQIMNDGTYKTVDGGVVIVEIVGD